MTIQLRSISKRFGRQTALRSVELDADKGSVIALLGANGAGKTTLLNIVATLTRPDRGSYRAFEVDAFVERSWVRSHLGYVAHRPFIYPELTCAENLRFFARLYSLEDPEDALMSSLLYVGLGDRADRPAYSLSRGLLQRLDLARALLHRPTLLILDEPDTGLDIQGRELLRRMMRERAAAGCLILFTSHALDFAIAASDRVVTLVNGEVAADTPTAATGTREIEEIIHRRHAAPVA